MPPPTASPGLPAATTAAPSARMDPPAHPAPAPAWPTPPPALDFSQGNKAKAKMGLHTSAVNSNRFNRSQE